MNVGRDHAMSNPSVPPPNDSSEVRELSLLLDIASSLSQSTDLNDVAGPVLKRMAEHMGMLRGTITILNRQTGELVIEEAYGLTDEERARGKYLLGEGVTGQVAQTGKPVVIPKVSQEPLFLDRTGTRMKEIKGGRKDISFLCVPIKLGKEVLGVLSADRLFDEHVSYTEDLRLLSAIATLIAQAVKAKQKNLEQIKVLREENQRLQDELGARLTDGRILGDSEAMRRLYQMILQVAPSTATVLIRGESGVGKELVASAIHFQSPRAHAPFVKVNCAALPEGVIESELFGHERGAFTDAVAQRKGRFELANGGTIFLDEISELSPAVQVKLLRVIQEREFERVGGTQTYKTDVRVVAATNRDLEQLIKDGWFREDLFYRLNVFPLYVPPLRERRTDILLLANHFVEKFSAANKKEVRRISPSATDLLMAHHWPGNVRELENCIERAVLLATDGVIHAHHLPLTLQTPEGVGELAQGRLQVALDALERELIQDALKNTRGNMARAARILDITERLMAIRVKRYKIDPKKYKSSKRSGEKE